MWFRILEALLLILLCVCSSVRCMQVFQLQRYQMKRYSGWLSANLTLHLSRYAVPALVAAVVKWYLPILLSLFIQVEKTRATFTNWAVLVCFCLLFGYIAFREIMEARGGFRMTMRVKRLTVAHAVIYLLLAAALLLLKLSTYFMYALIPYVSWAAGRFMKPIEDRINESFFREARRKLQARRERGDLICVGITGSRGKTVTKFILKELLSVRYDVLMTPASYNTAMGVSQTVNDYLEDHHQVFLAEMGAQYKGDIRKLANLVHPRYGIMTSIEPQHLDTLGSLEKVMTTKEELIKGLSEDGEAFFGGGNTFLDRIYERCEKKRFRATVQDDAADAFVCGEDILYTLSGTTFFLRDPEGKRHRCTTEMLGRFNVQDIVLATAVALRMGITIEEIVDVIGRLKPLPQHLELRTTTQGITVIDDRANRSEAGAADALNVLAALPGRRILVTGGLNSYENRTTEDDHHYGSMMRDCVDYLILVGGKREVKAMKDGATEIKENDRGLTNGTVRIVQTMDEAWPLIERVYREGDAVLLEGWLEE